MDLAFDEAVTDLHAQAVNAGVLGQRENISAFDPGLGGIFKALCDRGTDDRSGYVEGNIGRYERSGHIDPGIDGFQQEGAFIHLAEADKAVRRGRVERVGLGFRPQEDGGGKSGYGDHQAKPGLATGGVSCAR